MTKWHGTPADGEEVARLRARLAEAQAAWPAVLKIIREYDEAFPYAAEPDDDDAVSRLNAALSTPTDAKGGPR